MVETGYRQLIVMRHAKTQQEASSDRARVLTSRGRDDARAAGQWLQQHGAVPEVVLVSPAARATGTAELVCAELAPRPVVRRIDDLYGASPDDVVEIVAGVDAELGSVLVVGHNPTMADLAHGLRDDSTESWAPHLPTAGLVVLDVPGEWADLALGGCRLRSSHVPRG